MTEMTLFMEVGLSLISVHQRSLAVQQDTDQTLMNANGR